MRRACQQLSHLAGSPAVPVQMVNAGGCAVPVYGSAFPDQQSCGAHSFHSSCHVPAPSMFQQEQQLLPGHLHQQQQQPSFSGGFSGPLPGVTIPPLGHGAPVMGFPPPAFHDPSLHVPDMHLPAVNQSLRAGDAGFAAAHAGFAAAHFPAAHADPSAVPAATHEPPQLHAAAFHSYNMMGAGSNADIATGSFSTVEMKLQDFLELAAPVEDGMASSWEFNVEHDAGAEFVGTRASHFQAFGIAPMILYVEEISPTVDPNNRQRTFVAVNHDGRYRARWLMDLGYTYAVVYVNLPPSCSNFDFVLAEKCMQETTDVCLQGPAITLIDHPSHNIAVWLAEHGFIGEAAQFVRGEFYAVPAEAAPTTPGVSSSTANSSTVRARALTLRGTSEILNAEDVLNLPVTALPRVVYSSALGTGTFSDQTTILRDLLRDVTRNTSGGFGHGIYKYGTVAATVDGSRKGKGKHGQQMRFGCQQCLEAKTRAAADANSERRTCQEAKVWTLVYECSAEGDFVLVSQANQHLQHAFWTTHEEVLAGMSCCFRSAVQS